MRYRLPGAFTIVSVLLAWTSKVYWQLQAIDPRFMFISGVAAAFCAAVIAIGIYELRQAVAESREPKIALVATHARSRVRVPHFVRHIRLHRGVPARHTRKAQAQTVAAAVPQS